MQQIDEVTRGLGRKILEDYQKAELDEAGRLSRTLGRIGNSLLSPFSSTARGKAKQAKAVSFLMGKFKEFSRGRPWTPDLLHQFLGASFGRQIANTIMGISDDDGNPPPPPTNTANTSQNQNGGQASTTTNTANTATASATAPNTNTNGANAAGVAPGTPVANTPTAPAQIPGTPETKAKTLMRQPQANAMPTPAGKGANRGQILSQIAQQAAAKKTNPQQIMLLVNQLMQTGAAKGKNSPEYAAMLRDVASLKSGLGDIVPQIKTIPTPESFLPKRRKIR